MGTTQFRNIHGVAIGGAIPKHGGFFLRQAMTDTEAHNELEAQILAAQEGRITSDDLLKTLMGSQVFTPVQDLIHQFADGETQH